MGYASVIRSLLYFADDHRFCSEIISNDDIIKNLANFLWSENWVLTRLSWKFMKTVSQFPDILSQLLSNQNLVGKFAKLPTTNIALSKLLKFATNILSKKMKRKLLENKEKKEDPLAPNPTQSTYNKEQMEKLKECKKKLCDAMEPAIGTLVCIYKNVNIALKGQDAMKQIVQNYVEMILKSSSSEISAYKEKLKIHKDEKIKRSFLRRTTILH